MGDVGSTADPKHGCSLMKSLAFVGSQGWISVQARHGRDRVLREADTKVAAGQVHQNRQPLGRRSSNFK